MNITFCGHSDITESKKLYLWLSDNVERLIAEGARTFYLGGYGDFDRLAATVLKEKKRGADIESVLVLPYLEKNYDTEYYDSTLYPPLEIVKRNIWMVDKSDVIVAYVLHDFGGAAKTLEYAVRKKKRIIRYTENKARAVPAMFIL